MTLNQYKRTLVMLLLLFFTTNTFSIGDEIFINNEHTFDCGFPSEFLEIERKGNYTQTLYNELPQYLYLNTTTYEKQPFSNNGQVWYQSPDDVEKNINLVNPVELEYILEFSNRHKPIIDTIKKYNTTVSTLKAYNQTALLVSVICISTMYYNKESILTNNPKLALAIAGAFSHLYLYSYQKLIALEKLKNKSGNNPNTFCKHCVEKKSKNNKQSKKQKNGNCTSKNYQDAVEWLYCNGNPYYKTRLTQTHKMEYSIKTPQFNTPNTILIPNQNMYQEVIKHSDNYKKFLADQWEYRKTLWFKSICNYISRIAAFVCATVSLGTMYYNKDNTEGIPSVLENNPKYVVATAGLAVTGLTSFLISRFYLPDEFNIKLLANNVRLSESNATKLCFSCLESKGS